MKAWWEIWLGKAILFWIGGASLMLIVGQEPTAYKLIVLFVLSLCASALFLAPEGAD